MKVMIKMAHSKVQHIVTSRIFCDTEEFKRVRNTTNHVQIAPFLLILQPMEAAEAFSDVDFSYPGDTYMLQEIQVRLWSKQNEEV